MPSDDTGIEEKRLMRFTNKTAIVTGAAGGIGAAVAQRLADEGAKVAVVDLSVEAGKSTVESIVAAGGIAGRSVLM